VAQAVGEECAVGIVGVIDRGIGRCAARLSHGLAETQEFVAGGVNLVGFCCRGGARGQNGYCRCAAGFGEGCCRLDAGLAVAVGVIRECDARYGR
jgi:hypothetical protein